MAIRNFTANTLTAEVLKRVGKAPDRRMRQVAQSLVKHLHAFVKEVRPTPEEWFQGIQFLTKTGHMCDGKRQEFILMSDTLGVSMLVDFLNYGKAKGKLTATESTVLGPFFVEGAPEMPLGADIRNPGTPGEPCAVSGTIKDLKGKPVAGATIDVWEGGADGLYDVQKPDGTNLRARFRSDAQGRFHFKCITPVSYPVPHDGPVGKLLTATGRHPMRPGHLHFVIEAPGCDRLVTHLFTKGDKYLESDAVFGVKHSLIVDFKKKNAAGEAVCHYDFVLKPARARSKK
ncbi:MAG TPA: intradiol ring-cleavage dioxygenase [Burkholderiales bacterium]|nr:intradiol ring-cleavage dioxygenase [Burkholderiales bacterium]